MNATDIVARLNARPVGPGRWLAKCPAHDDKTPSLSIGIGDDGRILLRCFAGCAVETVVSAVGLRLGDLFTEPAVLPVARGAEESPEAKRSRWPRFQEPTRAELHAIGEIRCLGEPGLALAVDRGVLRVADYFGRVWVVTDPQRTAAQVRRLDGRPWKGGQKALTLPGSVCSVPLGLPHVAHARVVLLVEGGPDLLAAHHFTFAECREADTAAVALLGASQHVAEACLPAFAGKRVRLFPHVDENRAGRKAAARWTQAILTATPHVDGLDFAGFVRADGQPVKDLNDLARIDPDQFEARRDLWNIVPEPVCRSSQPTP